MRYPAHMLKVIGGQFKSRRLKTPRDSETTRPWTGRARETVFNQLRGHIPDGNILDLFAGVGTMGLEAASRGAKHVVMVESDRRIFALLEDNIKTLDCADHVCAVSADALGTVPLLRAPKPIDVAFIDPPYTMMSDESLFKRILQQVEQVGLLLADDGLIVLRSPINPKRTDHTIESLVGPEIHKFGASMWILFYGKKST
jgi:16S rRNA (guanine966-N2)-methyltransferase